MRASKVFVVLIAYLPVSVFANARTPIPGLESTGPEETLKTRLDLFGQIVGDWTFDVTNFNLDGSKLQGSGEWHFA